MSVHKKIAHWIIDSGYLFRGFSRRFIYKKPPEHYLGHVVEGKVAVVIIPGIMGRWTFMKSLGDKISRTGHPVYIVPELKYNIFSIPESAEILSKVIERILTEYSDIILVAHSKGGLIGKYYLAHHNDNGHVLGMISIATPYSGSAMARLIPHDSYRELNIDSKVIHYLETHNTVNSKIVSICPEYDHYVWAEKGSYLDGAENILVPVHGHHKILFDKDVQKVVLESIEKITQIHKSEI